METNSADAHESPSFTVIVTGISPNSMLSSETARLFASTGTTQLALLGPDEAYLAYSKSQLNQEFPTITMLVQEVDITSPESLGLASHNIRSRLGAWDIFIHNASAYLSPSPKTTIRGADNEIWWRSFECNVRSLHFIARHFFPKMKGDAVFINILSADVESPLEDKNSAESASATAARRVVEYMGKENTGSDFRVVNILPDARSHELASFLVSCAKKQVDFVTGSTLRGKP